MYTKESFQQKLKERFPDEEIEVITFNGIKNPCSFKCCKCNNVFNRKRAETLLTKGKKHLCQKCYNSKHDIQKQYQYKIQYLLKNNSNLLVVTDFSKVCVDMEFKCLKCENIFKRKPSVFLETQKCPYCESRSKKKPHNVFLEDLKNAGLEDYEILEEYSTAHNKILVRHNCGFIYKVTPHNLLSGKGCPKCSKKMSKGEKKIQEYLSSKSINFSFQKQEKINHKTLYFDFFIPSYNLYIEYQGEQHFHPIKHFGGESQYNTQIQNDELKREFCKVNNFPLLEISYKNFNSIEKILDKWFNDQSKDVVPSGTK